MKVGQVVVDSTPPIAFPVSSVIVLLWVYYSSQVVLFGAKFTRVYARHRGTPLEPKGNAVRVTRE